MFTPRATSIASYSLEALARCCGEFGGSEPRQVELVSILDDSAAAAVECAIHGVSEAIGVREYATKLWHLIPLCPCDSRQGSAQDLATNGATLCVLVCVSGEGRLMVSPNGGSKSKVRLELVKGMCVAYRCNTSYALSRADAVYLHCNIRDSSVPSLKVRVPVQASARYR
jgi:hypothetical protein